MLKTLPVTPFLLHTTQTSEHFNKHNVCKLHLTWEKDEELMPFTDIANWLSAQLQLR